MAWYNSAYIFPINNKDQSILNLKKAIELDSSHKEKANFDLIVQIKHNFY
jgi:hypothetical protein